MHAFTRCFDHPTAGSVGRDLVWCFDGLAGRWSDDLGAVVDANGRRVAIEAASAVGLWHPAAGADHELDSWREPLARAEVEQPFNQVGREVFVVEPHDQPTALYTARFGGVSVRYRQVLTVGKQRRWFASAAGYWSPEAPGCSFRDYRDGEWRVTMLFDVVGTGYVHATAETCISDQVQFARYDVTENGWRVRPLAEVPPIIFSEALRDVALLVEVGRIERVDAWFDRGHVRTPHWPSTAWVRGAFYELPASDGSWQRLHAPRAAPPRITS